MKFSELQQMLQEKLGIDHLADIARELGVSPQAVSNWKARDRVPYKYVLKIRKRLKKDDSNYDTQKGHLKVNDQTSLPPYANRQHVEKDTISLIDLLLILAKHLKIIIIMPTIFCSLMIIYVQF